MGMWGVYVLVVQMAAMNQRGALCALFLGVMGRDLNREQREQSERRQKRSDGWE